MTDIATVSNAEATASAVEAARRGEGVAVLVPCYNEAPTIAKVVSDFRAALPEATVYVYDNNSTDGTADIAAAAGAVVRRESRQGKGNVVRSMFRDIDAEYYLMVDGDDTYPAEAAGDLIAPLAADEADMTVGDRISNGAYGKENERPFHNFGNNLVRRLIKVIYGYAFEDVMTGYRAFTRAFVKTMPVMSGGFQIETEISIWAVDRRWRGGRRAHRLPRPARGLGVEAVPPSPTACSCWRPSRACSATTAPMAFFGWLGMALAVVGLCFGCPWWPSTSTPATWRSCPRRCSPWRS